MRAFGVVLLVLAAAAMAAAVDSPRGSPASLLEHFERVSRAGASARALGRCKTDCAKKPKAQRGKCEQDCDAAAKPAQSPERAAKLKTKREARKAAKKERNASVGTATEALPSDVKGGPHAADGKAKGGKDKLQRQKDRARSTNTDQGVWIGDGHQKFLELIKSQGVQVTRDGQDIPMPAGWGQVVKPDGSVVPATKGRVSAKAGNAGKPAIHAYPVV